VARDLRHFADRLTGSSRWCNLSCTAATSKDAS
jgi:hypothetical protein